MFSKQEKDVSPKPLKTLLARALYNNKPDYPCELTFTKGDVVTVLERNPKGYNGWWICSFAGQMGIAPGNFFEILGVVNKSVSDEEDPCYDDPAEWNRTPLRIEQSAEISQCQPVPIYENLDFAVGRYESVTHLTDSGNYSNRSSAFSHSLQSLNSTGRGVSTVDHTGVRNHRSTPDSQFDDYEDLDALTGTGETPPLSTSITPEPAAEERLQFCVQRKLNAPQPLVLSDSSNQSDKHPVPLPSKLDSTAPNNGSSCSSRTVKNFYEKPKFNQLFREEVEWPQTKSLKTFTRFCQLITHSMKDIVQYVQITRNNKIRLDMLYQLTQNLCSVESVCSTLINLSSQHHEVPLAKSFSKYQDVFKDIYARLSNFVPEARSSAQKTCKVTGLFDMLRLTSETMAALTATAVTNASLLFSDSQNLTNIPSATDNRLENLTVGCLDFDFQYTSSVGGLHPEIGPTISNKNDFVALQQSLQLSLRQLKENDQHLLQDILCDFEEFKEVGKSTVSSTEKLLSLLQKCLQDPSKGDITRYSESGPTANAIIDNIKEIVEFASHFLRRLPIICSTIESISLANAKSLPVNYLRRELESRGNSFHKNLTELVTQAKSVTQYVCIQTCDTDVQKADFKIIPTQIIQKLIGTCSAVLLSAHRLIAFMAFDEIDSGTANV